MQYSIKQRLGNFRWSLGLFTGPVYIASCLQLLQSILYKLQCIQVIQQQPQSMAVAPPPGGKPWSYLIYSIVCLTFSFVFAWICLACTIPAIIFSCMVSDLYKCDNAQILFYFCYFWLIYRVKNLPIEENGRKQDAMVDWHLGSTLLFWFLLFCLQFSSSLLLKHHKKL